LPGILHFPPAWNYVYDSYQYNSWFAKSGGPVMMGEEGFSQYSDDYPRPLAWNEAFEQPVYR
jgi:hypothetical protein